ncbi:hypothetical protein B0H13DRAFT_1863424 [Mycena leptocephala]|nr:hypothetical protein B0H13DRAFT_1863424 [Mycena leptocephala]
MPGITQCVVSDSQRSAQNQNGLAGKHLPLEGARIHIAHVHPSRKNQERRARPQRARERNRVAAGLMEHWSIIEGLRVIDPENETRGKTGSDGTDERKGGEHKTHRYQCSKLRASTQRQTHFGYLSARQDRRVKVRITVTSPCTKGSCVAWHGGRQPRTTSAAPLKDPNLWRRESASPNVMKKVRERAIGNVIYLAVSRGTGKTSCAKEEKMEERRIFTREHDWGTRRGDEGGGIKRHSGRRARKASESKSPAR